MEGGVVTVSETGDRPAADPETEVLPVDASPGVERPGVRAAAGGSAAASSGRRPRILRPDTAVAGPPELEPRRRIPWWWFAVALIAFALVGRGVIGAATRHDAGTPSAAPAATPAPPTATVTAEPAPTAPSPTVSVAATPPTVAPTTPPRPAHVILPRAGATTTTPSTSAHPSPSHSAATPVCAVSVDLAPFWGGYNATLTVRNTGKATVNGWQLSFRIGDQQHLVSGWGASVTGGVNGGGVLARDGGYNAVIAPGATAQFGLQVQVVGGGAGPSSWSGPSGFALNGGACS